MILISLVSAPLWAQDSPGTIWLLEEEHVAPDEVSRYMQWGDEFKAVAAKTGFQSFFVERRDNVFAYAYNVGTSMTDLDAFNKKFGEWANNNPEVGEMNKKYASTLTKRTRSLWRHMPKYSYAAEGAGDDIPNTYSRQYRAWIKPGKWSEAMGIMEEYLKLNKEAGISTSYNVYSNMFGVAANCITFRQTFNDQAAWAAAVKEFNEKVDGEKMGALYQRWLSVLNETEDMESTLLPNLSHVQSNQ